MGFSAVNDRAEVSQRRGHFPTVCFKADGKAVAGGDEFKHRRGRVSASGRDSQRQGRDRQHGTETNSPKLPGS
jgi:hypothetical protein